MAHWRIIAVCGDSKAVFQDSYANLTDFRYDGNSARVKRTQIIGGVDGGDPVTMTMGANQNGIEFAIAYGLLDSVTTGSDNILIVKVGFSSTQLRLNWRSYIANSLHQSFVNKVHAARRWCLAQGDTCEFNAAVMLLGVNDFEDGSTTLEDEMTSFITNTRRDFPDLPFVWCIPGTDIVKSGVTAGEITTARAGMYAAAAKFDNVDTYDETGVEYIDEVHQSSDGMLGVGGQGDGVLVLLETQGLTVDAFAPLTVTAREFTSLDAAQVHAAGLQLEHGTRDENPANGGFATRGPAARDPWPTTDRGLAVEKHPHHDVWIVAVDATSDAGPINTRDDLRLVDLSWFETASNSNTKNILVDGEDKPILDGNDEVQEAA